MDTDKICEQKKKDKRYEEKGKVCLRNPILSVSIGCSFDT